MLSTTALVVAFIATASAEPFNSTTSRYAINDKYFPGTGLITNKIDLNNNLNGIIRGFSDRQLVAASVYPDDDGYIKELEESYGIKFERNINKLPDQAEASKIPWPSSYWPVQNDGINVEWDDNQDSPVKKYSKAFKLNYHRLKKGISSESGIDSQDDAKRCITSLQCKEKDEHIPNGVCAKRRGKMYGRCVQSWYGLCHAWAPASILEQEPRCPIEHNGITFKVQDLKALMTQMYAVAEIDSEFTGARCDDANPDRDAYGRFKDEACRDISPAYFHIAIANLVGLLDRNFVVDIDAKAPVWNQPTRGYKVLEKKIVNVQEAMRSFRYGVRTDRYPFNSQAKKLLFLRTKFSYVVESITDGALVATGKVDAYTKHKYYEYILELNDNDDIIGGEWVGSSLTDHPDFLWITGDVRPGPDAEVAGIKYSEVRRLFDQSVNARC